MQRSSLYKKSDSFIKVEAEIENNVIIDIRISGNFIITPSDGLPLLEKHLRGVELNRKFLSNAISVVYLLGVKTPSLQKDDFVDAILGLVR